MFEIDRLKTPPGEAGNPQCRNGIIYDDEGVKKWFLILKRHPGEIHFTKPSNMEYEQVPAFDADGTPKVLHLYDPRRPEQTRGYSQLSSGLKDLQDLERYMEAEKLAALENACLTGIVKTNAPATFASPPRAHG